MDTNVLINKVKENGISLAIVLLCAWIAMGIFNKKKMEIASLKDQLENEQKKNALLGEMTVTEQKLSALRARVNTENKQDMSKLTNQINSLATASKVTITSMKPAVERSFGSYSKNIFEFSVNAASYHDIAKFVSVLEKSSDLFIVEGATMQSSQTAGQTEVTARIVISTVILKNQ